MTSMTSAARDPPHLRPHGFQLPKELKAVNALVERWATQTANGRPMAANAIARAIAEAEGAALPGGTFVLSEEVMIVDRIIARASSRTKRILEVWYRTPHPAEVKAHRLGKEFGIPMSRSTLYTEIKAVLWWISGALSQVLRMDEA